MPSKTAMQKSPSTDTNDIDALLNGSDDDLLNGSDDFLDSMDMNSPVLLDSLDPDILDNLDDLDDNIIETLEGMEVDKPRVRGRQKGATTETTESADKKKKKLTSRTLKTQMDRVLGLTPKPMCFDAIEFSQGGRKMYLANVPFMALQYLNCFDTEDLPPEMRSQREITSSRAIAIANYLIDRNENNQPYIFNAATIGIDTSLVDGSFDFENGKLTIPQDAFLSIYDGQHRITGTILAYASDPETFINDSIPVIFTGYTTIEEAQQYFSDINANIAKVNASLTTLYDHTDAKAEIIRKLLSGIPFLRNHVDKQKTTVSPKGSNIFTIVSLGNFVSNMFGDYNSDPKADKSSIDVSDDDKVSIASKYWSILITNISEFKQVSDKKLSVSDLRTNTVFSATAVIEALGLVFNIVYKQNPENWEEAINNLNFNKIDWSKLATQWDGVLLVNGRMNKSKATVTAIAEMITELASK